MTNNNSKRRPYAYVTDTGLVVKDSTLMKYALKTDEATDSKQLNDSFEGMYKADYLLQPLYNPVWLTNLPELNTYHASCCEAVATDVAGLGYTLMPAKDRKGTQTNKNKLTAFFDSIHPSVTQIINQSVNDRQTVGYGAIEIIKEGRSKTPPDNLAHIPSYTLRRHSDGIRVLQQIGANKVWFVRAGTGRDVNKDTGDLAPYGSLPKDVRGDEVIWIKRYTPRSTFYGLPPIIPAIGAIYGDRARLKYNVAFFDNYGVPAFAVIITGDFQTNDLEEDDPNYNFDKTLKGQIQANMQKLMQDPYSTLVLTIPSVGGEGKVNVELKPLATDTKEASFRLFRKDNRDEIIHAHKVPPYRIGINETGSLGGSNSEESTKIYKMGVINPIQSQICNSITYYVVNQGFNIMDWTFGVQEGDIRDVALDVDSAVKLISNAMMTPNQGIEYFSERFNLERSTDPLMDDYYMNGVPVSQLSSPQSKQIPVPAVDNVLKSLEDGLNDIAVKHDGLGDGGKGQGFTNAIRRIKGKL